MSLSDLASLGSFASGLAVLASLGFLYFQLRQLNAQVTQTEKNQRALMNQGVMTRATDINMWNARSDNASLTAKVQSGETEFSAPEIVQLGARLRVNLLAIQDSYVQHKNGLVDQITFDTLQPALRGQMSSPVFRAIWETARGTYSPEWVAIVDRIIAETPLREPVDLVNRFKTNLAKVTGRLEP